MHMKRMRIVLLCHFSNPSIRTSLGLHTGRHYKYTDFGLWNINIINGLKKNSEIELHVVAPHKGMKRSLQEFEEDGVIYHFFRSELPYPWAQIEYKFFPQSKRDYPRNRKIVQRIIKSINPDLVNLIGAENPYYSITALDIKEIPIILHCQTVYANPERKKTGKINMQCWDVELQLFHHIRYKACTGRMYYDLIKGYEPSSIVFPRTWPHSPFPILKEVPKTYDFAFFSRLLNRKKGFDNVIEALGIILKKHPEVRCLAIGSYDREREMFEKRIKELKLDKNLEIRGFFPEYTDMLQCVKQARFAVLPIKLDVISGTILEAMRIGLPVVTSRTSGTPSLNEKRNTVLISDVDDNDGLANNMIKLYENPDLAISLQENAYKYIEELDRKHADNANIMVAQYKAVLEHYHKGTPIPLNLLYNIEENIDYRKK